MPRFSPNHVPSYRRHKRSGQAIVTIAGRDHYLGDYDSPTSHEKYNQLVAAWFTAGRTPAAFQARRETSSAPTWPSVNEIIAAFWAHAQTYYRKNDKPTHELTSFKYVLKLIRRLYGSCEATKFGPLCLLACQTEMVRDGISRKSINRRCGRIKQVFKWAVSRELLPSHVYEALRTVEGLKLGRTEAIELPPVKPAQDHHIEATMAHASRHIRSMMELQLATGMRSGELVIMRTGDIDRTGSVWMYAPAHHKTEHHGHKRIVYLGAKSQAILTPFLKLDPGAYLFSPADADAERRADLAARRKTPLSCGNRAGTNKRERPKKQPGERYTTESYYRAVVTACAKAFPVPDDVRAQGNDAVKRWTRQNHFFPHQLRHAAATKFRKQSDIETTRVLLGQRDIDTTEIYAEQDVDRAIKFVAKIG